MPPRDTTDPKPASASPPAPATPSAPEQPPTPAAQESDARPIKPAEMIAALMCPACAGDLVAYVGENPHKAGTVWCATCGRRMKAD